jgi:hypothetical protein
MHGTLRIPGSAPTQPDTVAPPAERPRTNHSTPMEDT